MMPKEKLQITLIQSALHWENPEANRKMFAQKIAEIKETDIIILPEMFSTGFSMNAQSLAESRQSDTFLWCMEQSKKANALILGTFIVEEEGNYYNTALWAAPNGDFAFYDKKHLFRMAEENKVYSKGKERLIKEYLGWRICPLICYDLRFPIWSRNKLTVNQNTETQTGYDLLIYMANWPEVRISAWNILLRARAIENLAYVAGVNRIGEDKNTNYSGDSLLLNPKGESIFEAKSDEIVQTVSISYSEMVSFRQKFPAYLDADN